MFLVSTCCCVLAVKIKTLSEKHNSFTVPGGFKSILYRPLGEKKKNKKKKKKTQQNLNKTDKKKIQNNTK